MAHQEQVWPVHSSLLKRTSGDLFKNMVTPDRIPEFMIPSLDILEGHCVFGKEKRLVQGLQEREASRSKSRVSPKEDCCRFRPDSLPTSYASIEVDATGNDIPDPVTRAALSLPHLPKITTPYVFLALGESPHITKEEAMFFQFDLASLGDPSPKRDLEPQVGRPQSVSHGRTPAACTDVSSKDHTPCRAQKLNRPCLSHQSLSPIRGLHGFNPPGPPAMVDPVGPLEVMPSLGGGCC